MKAMSVGHFKGKVGNSHVPCHVTGYSGVIWNHTFVISDHNLSIHYITFMGIRWRLRGVYMEHPSLWSSFWLKDLSSQKRAQ